MKFLITSCLIFLFGAFQLISQDSTEIYFRSESPDDHTRFEFSFENKSQVSVLGVKLRILTDGYSFTDASISGEAQTRGWEMAPVAYDSIYVSGEPGVDVPFSPGQTAGVFHFELAGDDGIVDIQWSTLDTLGGVLKTGVSKVPVTANNASCWSISRTASAEEFIRIDGNFFTGSGFTWETWFYINQHLTDNSDGYNMMIASADFDAGSDGNCDVYLGFGHANLPKNHLVFNVGTDIANMDMSGVSAGWHHAAGVWTPSGIISVYLDGLGVSNSASSNLPISLNSIDIGRWYDNDYYFEGMLDEIRFWKTAKTSYEIVDDMYECDISDQYLYAYYPITINDIATPTNPAEWGCYLIDHTTNNLNSEISCGTDWDPENAPLECCDSLHSTPCLCQDEQGNLNYEIINVTNLNDPDDCCWRIELDIKCDMLFINRLWFDFPAVSPLSPISAPSGWNVVPSALGSGNGYIFDFPGSFLPQGVHVFDMCFSSPTNPAQFPVEIHLLDYYDDNNYSEECDPLTAIIQCDSICTCDQIYISDIKNDSLPDDRCCHEVTVRADCDKQEIVYLEFEYENNLISSWSTSSGWTSLSGTNNSDKYEADAGNILTGDHNFMFCFPIDIHKTTIILHYHGASDYDVCPPDTFDLACGCCDNFEFRTTYNLYNISNWSNCSKTQYTFVTLEAGPKPVSRVAMQITKAIRTYQIEDLWNGSVSTHTIPLLAFFVSTSTPTSWCPTCNPPGGNPWVPFTGSGNSASLGENHPYLDLDYISYLHNNSRSELIWGGFNSIPATDISDDSDNNNSVNYRITFRKTCNNVDFGNILADTIKYWIRYYITDEDCCTCDTLVQRTIVIPVNKNNSSAVSTMSINMDNLTTGTLNYINDSLYFPPVKIINIKSICLEPLGEDVQVTSMKNPITGEDAIIENNIATLSGPFILDSIPELPMEFANPNRDFMFRNKVTILFEGGENEDKKVTWPEEFIVTAKVPSDDSPDILGRDYIPEGMMIKTFSLYLTNNNIYEEPIAFFKLHPTCEDCEIAAVGKPLSDQAGKVLIKTLDVEDKMYSISDTYILDSIPVLWPENWAGIKPNETASPIYVTVLMPEELEGQMTINYTTYNNEGIQLSQGDLNMPVSGVIRIENNDNDIEISCYPNPAKTTVTFDIHTSKVITNVSLLLYDEFGNNIGNIMKNQNLNAGTHVVPYDISNLISGTYYYKLTVNGLAKTKVLNIVR